MWRRKQARPGGGSPGRTMDSQGRKVVVCDNGTGVRPGGAAACVCGVRAGPSAARLGCGGAGRRAGGLSGGAGQPDCTRRRRNLSPRAREHPPASREMGLGGERPRPSVARRSPFLRLARVRSYKT